MNKKCPRCEVELILMEDSKSKEKIWVCDSCEWRKIEKIDEEEEEIEMFRIVNKRKKMKENVYACRKRM